MSQKTISAPYPGTGLAQVVPYTDWRDVAPRRNGVDMMATGQVRSDHWHRGLESVVVARNHNQFPSIRFYSDDGAIPGVALGGTSGCEYARGMANPRESVHTILPRDYDNIKKGILHIIWPGYQNLRFKQEINFCNENGVPLTRAEMGAQIAFLWRTFYNKYQKSFSGQGVPLGEHNVSFGHLRLLQLYSGDGRNWHAELSYVKTSSVKEIYPGL